MGYLGSIWRATESARRGSSVRLEKSESSVTWVQVAAEGPLLGHTEGFVMTRELFEQAVANLRSHPSFTGDADVIPWDIGHLSELPRELQPIGGVPASAWTQDLEVRNGPNGEAQLWAKTRWLEPLRSQIRNEEFQFASISIIPEAIDVRTGDPVGALITSIAATNGPAVEGMERLAATRTSESMNNKIDVTGYPGRNTSERLHSYVKANMPGVDKMTYDQSWDYVFAFDRSRVIDRKAAPVEPTVQASSTTSSKADMLAWATGGRSVDAGVSRGGKPVMDLSDCPGRDRSERITAWLSRKFPGELERMNYDQKFDRIFSAAEDHQVIDPQGADQSARHWSGRGGR
jgi:hypothetical protein